MTPANTATISKGKDPAVGRTWWSMYPFRDGSYYREETMAFTMSDHGRTDGTVSSKSGAYASIVGNWYRKTDTGLYYISPITCMSLQITFGEVLGPHGEKVNWDPDVVGVPGVNNEIQWCEDPGQSYEMKLIPPHKLVETSYPDTSALTGVLTFTTKP